MNYYLALLITYIASYAGALIANMAIEEMKPGKKYLNILRHALFIIILIAFFALNPSIPFIIFIAALIIIFSLSRYRETLYYYALAPVFFLSWNYNGFKYTGPLIFLYSLVLGSLYFAEHMDSHKEKKALRIMPGLTKTLSGFLVTGIVLGLLI